MYIYSSIVYKYNLEVLVLYLTLFHYIPEGNIVLNDTHLITLRTSYFK